MKRNFQKLIAGIMAVAIACQFQVPTLAASEDKAYVSEVIISYGEGDSAEADAKQWLTDNGYEIVDTNLNAGAESGASSEYISWATGARAARAVYLGYKTTTDSSQAITSLKSMNMTGSYSFDSYQEVLDSMADEIASFMADFKVTISEWRENYNAGRGKAVEVYNLLNLMYSPDNNNMKMGDLLLNETKEELGDAAYNKLSDEDKLLHADMTTILMQGNSDATKYIEQLLAMGADTDTEKTWLDRLSEMGTYDDMMDSLEKEADEKGETFLPSEAASQLTGKYDTAAALLAVKIADIQTYFKEYVNSGTSLNDDENKILSYINKNYADNSVTVQQWFSIGTLYEALAAYKYPSAENPDRTLQDFFMEEFDPDDADSRTLLYPMAAALSDGQRSAIEFVSLNELISQGIVTDTEAAATTEQMKDYMENGECVSVFAGVDRSIYDSSSTALTSSARELQNASQKSYTEGMFGTPYSLMTTISAAVFAACLVTTVSCAVAASAIASSSAANVIAVQTARENAYNALLTKLAESAEMEAFVAQQGSAEAAAYTLVRRCEQGIDQYALKFIDDFQAVRDYVNQTPIEFKHATLIKAFQAAAVVMCVVTIAVGVWTVISGINDLKAYYNTDMDLYPIPENIVDEAETASGDKTYTYYKAVQSNRTEKGYTEDRESLKDNADLNGDLGKEWLALYYTKDAGAGNPIVVSDVKGFQVVTGSDSTPSGLTALTLFDQESPVNLTNEEWVWNDKTGGLYLYYATGSAANAASIFAGTSKWFILGGIGVIIALCFFFGGLAVGRRRKNKGEGSALGA